MANQTELLNVSDEMKLDDERQSFEGLECGEGLCSSSSDTTEELYSSSAPDTCGDCRVDVKGKIGIAVKRLEIKGFKTKGSIFRCCFWSFFFLSGETCRKAENSRGVATLLI